MKAIFLLSWKNFHSWQKFLLQNQKNLHSDVNVMQNIPHKNAHGIYFGDFQALKKEHDHGPEFKQIHRTTLCWELSKLPWRKPLNKKKKEDQALLLTMHFVHPTPQGDFPRSLCFLWFWLGIEIWRLV